MPDQPTPQQTLDTPMDDNDAEAATIREYLTALLAEVWRHADGFSGKRPFGNSGWQYDVFAALGKAGHIRATFDEDGYVDDVDEPAGDALILAAIKALGEAAEPHHIVDLRANGWTVQHPDGCRPNLFDCPVNVAAERDLVNQPVRLGRFVCALDDDGRFEVGAEATDA